MRARRATTELRGQEPHIQENIMLRTSPDRPRLPSDTRPRTRARRWLGFSLGLAAIALLPLVLSPLGAASDQPSQPRLYALDGGRIDLQDLGMFADTGDLDHKPGKLIAAAYLVRHPQGTLLWDTGLSDALAANKDGVSNPAMGAHIRVTRTLSAQLSELGLTPKDITHLAFSHLHPDHTGNANAFPTATWILDEHELAWATATPTPHGVDLSSFSAYKSAKRQTLDGDLDVFGDGTVRILRAPGHTPGHHVLLVSLKKAGKVLISGDLYHTRLGYQRSLVPAFNASRADTLASFDRVQKLIKNTKARLIVQHAVEDFEALPKVPAYLE
jgi:glyoxylase-like metal-dependent hydrolase (beta-lactamase superfamily II)